MLDGQEYKVPPTIEDINVLEILESTIRNYGINGKTVKIYYEEDIPGSPLRTKLKMNDNDGNNFKDIDRLEA